MADYTNVLQRLLTQGLSSNVASYQHDSYTTHACALNTSGSVRVVLDDGRTGSSPPGTRVVSQLGWARLAELAKARLSRLARLVWLDWARLARLV